MNAAANLNLVVAHTQRPTQTLNSSVISAQTPTLANITTKTSASSTTTNTTTITNGSLSDSLTSTDGQRTPNVENLSKTNLYIRGLQVSTNDQDLYNMCSRYGQISSTKAILEKATGCCKGTSTILKTSPSRVHYHSSF